MIRTFRHLPHASPAFLIHGIVFLLLLAGCSGEADTAERLPGAWKNGDGNLIFFEAEGKATIGQEGLEGRGDCRYEVDGDSVKLITLPDGPEDSGNIFDLYYSGDTLFMAAITLVRPGERSRISGDQLQIRLGKPLYKLHFTRVPEEK
ncbi:MAG: hypothetical protein JXA28_02600 [Bacteroidetes bacterium]|nr:hypothetical protein [Bacteroidota bacterium]